MPRPSGALAALLALALLVLVLPGAASANDAGSVTHASGALSATLSWQKADLGVADPR